LPVRSVKDSRIAFLGTGDIGREAARRFSAFDPASMVGINRSGSDRSGLFDRVINVNELDAALENAEILVISLPKTQETVRLLDKRRLSLLPDGALIVNVGRGAVIDETALAMELRAGRLLAALDVFEQEPLPDGSPLWDCPNLLITPHISGNMTLEYTKNRLVAMFLEDFENYCTGRPLKHMVDLKKGY
ncbi:MAG: NAD(P)-binding domain-containing protein, partial [Clostridia bacterium]|nr:NAD(P)-binding domain-containing protein [Clostridia bacterium]